MTTTAVIRTRIEILDGLLRSHAARLWAVPDQSASYADYLVRMHFLTRASVPLMERALEHARSLSDDPVAAMLVPYFEHHIPEERGHERWIVEDLPVIDPIAAARVAEIPSVAAAEMVGAQYYWLTHHHPVAVLGYIMFAEGSPPATRGIDALRELTGLPKEAFRTLYRHAKLDVRHRRELFALVDSLPLTETQIACVSTAATHASVSFLRMHRDLEARALARQSTDVLSLHG